MVLSSPRLLTLQNKKILSCPVEQSEKPFYYFLLISLRLPPFQWGYNQNGFIKKKAILSNQFFFLSFYCFFKILSYYKKLEYIIISKQPYSYLVLVEKSRILLDVWH